MIALKVHSAHEQNHPDPPPPAPAAQLVCLCLQFMSTIYSATTANFNSTVTSTAVKRSGYAYVTTSSSGLAALPSVTQWTQELSFIANANVC